MRVNFLQFYTEVLFKWLLNTFHADVKNLSSHNAQSLSTDWQLIGAAGFGAGTGRKDKWVLGQLLCIVLC